MDRKHNLLIICQNQFGYHIDAYYLCQYLKDTFDITYLCWDYNLDRVSMSGVNVIYIQRDGAKALRLFLFILQAVQLIRTHGYDVIFLKYFATCSLIRLFHSKQPFILDIRTGAIDHSPFHRRIRNTILYCEALCFHHITIISASLAKKLNLHHRATILPLGAVQISAINKQFIEIHLLYVGTFHNRNIDKTIVGFAQLYEELKEKMQFSYTIIGYGSQEDELFISKLIHDHSLTDIVHYRGRIPHDQLYSFFDSHNVGVSFVPMTDYFDVQPVTKTFEYLLSGMAVLATRTSENARVVDENNGVLINDTSESFYDGLKILITRRNQYDSTTIMQYAQKYHWEKIVDDFKTDLLSMCNS